MGKRRMESIVGITLILVMLCSFSLPVIAQEPMQISDVLMELPERFVIPAETETGVPIVAIGDGAFEGQENLRIVVIPDSVTSVGANAFRDCSRLMLVLIPETVRDIADNAFQGVNSAYFCIVTPMRSEAASFAKKQGFQCLELPCQSLAGCQEELVSMALFFSDPMNGTVGTLWDSATGKSASYDIDEYLIEEMGGSYDTFMLALNNMDLAFYTLLDLFIPVDSNTFMAKVYAKEIGEVLAMMADMEVIQLNMSLLTESGDFASKGIDSYSKLLDWLDEGGWKYNTFLHKLKGFQGKLDSFVTTVENAERLFNFLMHNLQDYTACLEMLDLLRDMAESSEEKTFLYAVNQLEREYDTEFWGLFNQSMDKLLMPAMVGAAEDGLIALGGAAGLYVLAQKGIELGLEFTGSAELRDKELAYVALLNICIEAESMYRRAFQNCDGTEESLQRLQLLWAFNCYAHMRIFSLQQELFESQAMKNEMAEGYKAYAAALTRPDAYFRSAELHSAAAADDMLVLTSLLNVPTGALRTMWYAECSYDDTDWTKCGYSLVKDASNYMVDGISLGSQGAWSFEWGELPLNATGKELLNYYLNDEMYGYGSYSAFSDSADLLRFLYSSGRVAAMVLVESESYHYIRPVYEDGEYWYDSEIWYEYYVWTGTIVGEDGMMQPVTIMMELIRNTEGENVDNFMILPEHPLP